MKEAELVEGVELEVSRGRFVGEGPSFIRWNGAGDAEGVNIVVGQLEHSYKFTPTRIQTPRILKAVYRTYTGPPAQCGDTWMV